MLKTEISDWGNEITIDVVQKQGSNVFRIGGLYFSRLSTDAMVYGIGCHGNHQWVDFTIESGKKEPFRGAAMEIQEWYGKNTCTAATFPHAFCVASFVRSDFFAKGDRIVIHRPNAAIMKEYLINSWYEALSHTSPWKEERAAIRREVVTAGIRINRAHAAGEIPFKDFEDKLRWLSFFQVPHKDNELLKRIREEVLLPPVLEF